MGKKVVKAYSLRKRDTVFITQLIEKYGFSNASEVLRFCTGMVAEHIDTGATACHSSILERMLYDKMAQLVEDMPVKKTSGRGAEKK